MKRFLNLVVYILTIHVSALLIAGLFRLVLFISSYHQLTSEALSDKTLPMLAFVHGVWFDNVIGCYILLLPLVVAVVCGVCNYYGKALFRFFTIFFSVFYGLVYLISASDIPYFAYFFKHINSSIFEWFGYAGTTAGMILGESAYYLSIGLFLLFLAGFVVWLIYLARYFHHRSLTISAPFPYWKRGGAVLIGACLIGLCIFGIRGRTGYNPIKVSAAYFCQDAFLNQLGVSPTFNLLTSVMDDMRPENKYLHLMDEQEAITKAQALLNRPGDANVSPLAVYRRAAKADSVQQRRPNVVLIMMESMSAKFMKHFGQSETLTPFLDSLYTRSISFRNFYSAGIHTNHGLYATLYSFPAMMKRNLMKGSVIPRYSGLPTVLKENGYYNLFFMTHEGQYDNMNAFFRTNGYDEVFSQENYPADKVVNSFGVQDDFLYDYAIPVLNQRAATGQPFFATLLSISNHPPYVIPPFFHPKTSEPETQIVEYADWALRQFFEEARKQPWFDNTIFVLESGSVLTNVYILEDDFSSGTAMMGWGNNSTRQVIDGVHQMTNPSEVNSWEAQAGYDFSAPLTEGTTYFLKMKIKGSVAGSIGAVFQKPDGFAGRGDFPSIPITTEWEEVTVFTNCTGDAATRILFNYGKYAGTIYIDDLSIYWQKSGNTIPLTPEEKEEILTNELERWIKGMLESCGGYVKAWDVVNEPDRKSTRLNSSHRLESRMPSSA